VLDVGCGNGRLATFLFERFPALRYTGVDRSEELLAEARERLSGQRAIELITVDLLAAPIGSALPVGPFDLVTMFGVLHHLPGRATRVALLEALAGRVGPGGHLAFNVWRCRDDARIAEKIVPWPEYTRLTGRTIDLGELEEGDFILPWSDESTVAYRYCHEVAAEEIDAIAASTMLAKVADLGVGGPSGDLDRVLVFGRH